MKHINPDYATSRAEKVVLAEGMKPSVRKLRKLLQGCHHECGIELSVERKIDNASDT